MSDLQESGLTIKSGTGYDAMWATPKGSPEEIKLWLMQMFALPEDAVAGLSPYEVAVMAEDVMQGRHNIAQQLGGTVVADQAERPTKADAWSDTGSRASEQAEAKGPDNGWLIEALGSAKTLADTKRLWVENRDSGAFEDQAVKDAYNSRNRTIKAAAA
jgi:hypothetical protein